MGLSGCLFGPDDTTFPSKGSLLNTPAFLGCSEGDPHFPAQRVTAAAEILTALGATVTTRLYPELDHGVNDDEIRADQGDDRGDRRRDRVLAGAGQAPQPDDA